LSFDQTVTKRSVPSGGWATWSGCPPTCPDVLQIGGETITATFSPTGLVGGFGLETEPYFFTDKAGAVFCASGPGWRQGNGLWHLLHFKHLGFLPIRFII
jgi:hypothetical protein